MKKYRAEQFLSITGSECGTEVELKQVVVFTVNPGCAETQLTPAEPPTVDDVVIRHFAGIFEIDQPEFVSSEFVDSRSFKEWLLSEANEQAQAAADDAEDRRLEAAAYPSTISEEA